MTQPLDSSGRQINIDDVVAFNRSGAVISGRVIDIKPKQPAKNRYMPRRPEDDFLVRIQDEDGRISTVKCTLGILVI